MKIYYTKIDIVKDLKHRNWLGPYISGGKFQQSVNQPDVPSYDNIDECAKQHDLAYSKDTSDSFFSESLASIDSEFISCVRQVAKEEGFTLKGLIAYLIAEGVNLQRMARKFVPNGLRKRMAHKGKSMPAVQRRIAKRAIKKVVRKVERKRVVNANPVSRSMVRFAKRSKLRLGRGKGSNMSKPHHAIGTDYYGTIDVTASTKKGDILATIPVIPTFIQNTRLSRLCSLWDKYCLRYFSVEYETQSPTSQGGQLVMFYEPDPLEANVSNPQLVTKATSSPGSRMFAPYDGNNENRVICTARPTKHDPDRYISNLNSGRETSYGNIYVISNSTFTSTATIGTIKVSYHFVLKSPILEDSTNTDYYYSKFTFSTPTIAAPLGASWTVGNGFNNINNIRRISSTVMEVDPGFYFVVWSLSATTVIATPYTFATQNSALTISLVTNANGSASGVFGYFFSHLGVTPIQATWADNGNTAPSAVTIRVFRMPNTLSPEKNIKLSPQEKEIMELRDSLAQLKSKLNDIYDNNSCITRPMSRQEICNV